MVAIDLTLAWGDALGSEVNASAFDVRPPPGGGIPRSQRDVMFVKTRQTSWCSFPFLLLAGISMGRFAYQEFIPKMKTLVCS